MWKMRAARLCVMVLMAAAGLALAQGPVPADDVVLPAEFRWAQRKDRILLTIELQVGVFRRVRAHSSGLHLRAPARDSGR